MMTPRKIVENLFHPIGFRQFASTYFPHLLFHSAPNSDRVGWLADAGLNFDWWPEDSNASGRIVAVRRHACTFRQEKVDVPQAIDRLSSGWTISCLAVNEYFPILKEIHALLAEVMGVSNDRVFMNLYKSGADCGSPKHFDCREVFVLQLHGTKIWQLSPNLADRYPLENVVASGPGDKSGVSTEMERDCQNVKLLAGALLFVPRGMWHRTIAETASLSLTISVATPTRAEHVSAALRARLEQNEEWRRPVFPAASFGDVEVFDELLSILAQGNK